MGRKYTEAQKNATIKYLKENTDELKIRMPKGKKEEYRILSESAGYKSFNQFILDAIEDKISRIPRP